MIDSKDTWDEYAHVYVMGLNDYMNKVYPFAAFESIKLQKIYNFGRFVQPTQK
jgi:hypothetical protein